MSAMRRMQGADGLFLRLFESTGTKQSVRICMENVGIFGEIDMNPYEVKTLQIDLKKKCLKECSMLGGRLQETPLD